MKESLLPSSATPHSYLSIRRFPVPRVQKTRDFMQENEMDPEHAEIAERIARSDKVRVR